MAIVIVIVMIGFGVISFKKIQSMRNIEVNAGPALHRMATEAYNSKIDSYFGQNKSYAETKALINTVKMHNNKRIQTT